MEKCIYIILKRIKLVMKFNVHMIWKQIHEIIKCAFYG